MASEGAAIDLRERYAREHSERGFQSDPAQLVALERLEALRRRLIAARARAGRPRRLTWRSRREGPERGVYLWGAVGRGKTWLMDLFFRSLPFREARRTHFHRFMYDVHAALKEARQLENALENPLEEVAARIAREARVLCFDEFAVSDIADAMILGGLLSGLASRGVCLVATSNVHPRDLYKGGLQRERFLPAIELIERSTQVVEVAGATDYRLRRLTDAGLYVPAQAPDAEQRLARLFEALGGESTPRGGAIEIEGRSIPVVRLSDGIVWFEFSAVCAGPRAAADYIEIAREFGSVIVSGVPVFDPSREDEARRFIALVDELYDHNVNLVLSAAAPPEELYRGERLALEFRRTASRLVEMQSAEYLAREHLP